MFFENYVTSLAVLSVVFAMLSPFNVVALYSTVRLVCQRVNERTLPRLSIYAKCAVTCDTCGIVVVHGVRELTWYFLYPSGCRVTHPIGNAVDLVCLLSLYAQPMSCLCVVFYAHYKRKLLLQRLERENRRSASRRGAERSTVAPSASIIPVASGVPVREVALMAPVAPLSLVEGRLVADDRLSSFEQRVLEWLQEPRLPRSHVHPTERAQQV